MLLTVSALQDEVAFELRFLKCVVCKDLQIDNGEDGGYRMSSLCAGSMNAHDLNLRAL